MKFIFSGLYSIALVCVLSYTPAAQAWLGTLGKLGSTAGKAAGTASTAGKGAAVGVVGVEAVEATNAAAQAAKGANAAKATGMAAHSADEIAKASGLGKAVPDDIAAMLHSSGKTLSDVPDPGTRSWLSKPLPELSMQDANAMVRDYAKLLEGKAAFGPAKSKVAISAAPSPTSIKPEPLPKIKPGVEIPWHALELLFRAGHAGHQAAQREAQRLCEQREAKPGSMPLGQPRCSVSLASSSTAPR